MPTAPLSLDALDRRILAQLQTDADMGLELLAERVGSSASTCHRRVGQLKSRGMIREVVAICDPAVSAEPICALIGITLVRQDRQTQEETRRFLLAQPQVRGAWLTAGDFDYMALCRFSNLAATNSFLNEALGDFAPIRSFKSFLSLEQLKFDTALAF